MLSSNSSYTNGRLDSSASRVLIKILRFLWGLSKCFLFGRLIERMYVSENCTIYFSGSYSQKWNVKKFYTNGCVCLDLWWRSDSCNSCLWIFYVRNEFEKCVFQSVTHAIYRVIYLSVKNVKFKYVNNQYHKTKKNDLFLIQFVFYFILDSVCFCFNSYSFEKKN